MSTYLYLKYMWNRVHKLNFNYSEVTVGDPGTGKTKKAILKCFLLNRYRFDETFYCNTAKEFLQMIDDSRNGDTGIWDEQGVSMNSRRSLTLSNVLTGETLQTYRINKLAVEFISPDLSFIDVQARKLINAFTETKRYDNERSFNWVYKLQTNRQSGKVYFPHFRAVINGRLHSIKYYELPNRLFRKIPKETVKRIVEKEIEFKYKLRKRNLQILELLEKEEGGGEGKTIFDLINEVQKDIEKYKNTRGRLDWKLIKTHLRVSRDRSQQIATFIQKKLPHA